MGKLMLNEKCYTGSRYLLMNGENYSSVNQNYDFYLINPDYLDIIGSNSSNKNGVTPFIELDQSTSTSNMSYITTYNDEKVLCLPPYGNKAYGILTPINKCCKKIKINVTAVNGGTGSYNNSNIILTTNPVPSSVSGWSTEIKNFYFTDYSMTAAQINAQSYLTINSTTNTGLANQIVEINVEAMDLNIDKFYIGLHSCDCYLYIRSIQIKF